MALINMDGGIRKVNPLTVTHFDGIRGKGYYGLHKHLEHPYKILLRKKHFKNASMLMKLVLLFFDTPWKSPRIWDKPVVQAWNGSNLIQQFECKSNEEAFEVIQKLQNMQDEYLDDLKKVPVA